MSRDRENCHMPGRDYVGELSQHLGDSGILLVGSARSDLIYDRAGCYQPGSVFATGNGRICVGKMGVAPVTRAVRFI